MMLISMRPQHPKQPQPSPRPRKRLLSLPQPLLKKPLLLPLPKRARLLLNNGLKDRARRPIGI